MTSRFSESPLTEGLPLVCDENSAVMGTTNGSATIHGVLVNVAGVGVLITGESGSGKSECALKLVSCGHKLVADDVIEVSRSGLGLTGSAPRSLRGILAVRDIGLIDIRRLFGKNAVTESTAIDLIVKLVSAVDQLDDGSSFGPGESKMLDVTVPRFVWGSDRNRDLALLIETAARAVRDPQSLVNADQISA